MREMDRVARIAAEWARERPDLDVAPQAVFGRLHRLAARLTEELSAVYRRHGLSEADFDVLATLRRAGEPFERSAGELADWTMVTTGGMSKRLDRLERDGLVTRRPSVQDGRARVVSLTQRGREVIDAAFTDHIANEHRLLELVGPRDRRALERILREWLAHFE
ncbi:MarR family winged helix-turn-helix transcriptional regulator [Leifsonia sp. AG29]|uniref:MarR family winged helix-turn-helix transcriptional regulator n=1 Tax=Leifsonia sp. AG29 TaxID=2598860 RepID=UPI00131CCF8A|nr:MarR family transcriptional regulator [Leifsonia sp. AG29]